MIRRALVTGANGFIGSALLRACRDFHIIATGVARVAGIAGNVSSDYSADSIASLVDRAEADLLVHAAGSSSVAESMNDPARDFAASVSLTQRVLEGVRRSSRRPRILLLSSAAVYGNPNQLPVSEDAGLAPISAYGYHKAMCEQLLREYVDCFDLAGTSLRIFSVFGEAQRKLLVWELFQRYREKPEVELMGTGNEERDYLHVDDLARLIWRSASSPMELPPVLNVASGTSIRASDLASRIGAALEVRKPVVCRGISSRRDPVRWRADISLLRKVIGAPPEHDLERRLRQLAEAWTR
ncbi:MAG: NAD-dependent epimerase/dehydratase family protein [Burkholderiales bacterium]